MSSIQTYQRTQVVQQALEWLEHEVREADAMDSPTVVKDYLRLGAVTSLAERGLV